MLDVLFPYSYVAILLGIVIGIISTTMVLGCISVIIIIILIYSEVIRITPILTAVSSLVNTLLPSHLPMIQQNVKESFTIRFTETIPEGKYIFACHPHGVFSMSHFFHIGTRLTDWPSHLRPIKITTLSILQWLPFGKELFENVSAVPSEYHAMKNVLLNGESISVAVGGMREMLGHEYNVSRRRGIFKMALETGTPIVPMLSFGEHSLFSLVPINPAIQAWLEPYDICICIPTLHSISKWIGMLYNPLKNPIMSVVGKPISVVQIDNPTEKDISDLRHKYIDALKELFTKENPNKGEVVSIL